MNLMKAHNFLLALLFVALNGHAPVSAQWTRLNGPYGHTVYKIHVKGTDIYASTMAGIYKSTDGGANWSYSSSGIPATIGVTAVRHINNVLFAGQNGGGVFTSLDNGSTWTASALTNTQVMDLAVIGNAVFAAAANGVYTSSDNGATWTTVNSGLPSTYVLNLFAEGTTLYASTASGVAVSSNMGQSWTTINSQMVSSIIRHNGKLFITSNSAGVYRSSDNGASWVPVNAGIAGKNCSSLGSAGGRILLGTHQGGVYASSDDGDTWTSSGTGLIPQYSHYFLTSGTEVFHASETGIYKSADSGISWSSSNNGILPYRITTLLLKGDSIYAGAQCGLFFSPDIGLSWSMKPSGINYMYINKLLNFNNTLYAATYNGVYKSTDDGNSWQKDMGVTGVIYDGTYNSASIFMGDGTWQGKGIKRSDDNGASWIPVNTGLSNIEIRSLAAMGTTIFAATGNGFFRSADNGDTWSEVTLPGITNKYTPYTGVCNSVAFASALGSFFSLYRSVDGGLTWGQVTNGGTSYGAICSIIADNGIMFAGGSKGVYRSLDNGVTWTSDTIGLGGSKSVSSLIVKNGVLYAGTDDGIFSRQIITDINESREHSQNISVYPNPFTGRMFISGLNGQANRINVYSVSGTLVSRIVLEGREGSIDLEPLSPGVYILEVQGDKAAQKIKVVKGL
jgi:hypothetical protein